jgi:hypothetical protein
MMLDDSTLRLRPQEAFSFEKLIASVGTVAGMLGMLEGELLAAVARGETTTRLIETPSGTMIEVPKTRGELP